MRQSGGRPSSSSTGREFMAAYDTLQQEDRECSLYLGDELDGEMSVEVEGEGRGGVDASSRTLLTQQIEKLRASMLFKALREHPDRKAEPT